MTTRTVDVHLEELGGDSWFAASLNALGGAAGVLPPRLTVKQKSDGGAQLSPTT